MSSFGGAFKSLLHGNIFTYWMIAITFIFALAIPTYLIGNANSTTEHNDTTTDDVKYANTDDEKIKSSSITIVHVSDTHGFHDQINFPQGDILIHTGDFCNDGTKEEYQRFNQFLGKQRSEFPLGIFVVLGNHDYKFLDASGLDESLIHTMADDELRKTYFQQLLSNAKVIDHETVELTAKIKDETHTLSIFGAPWTPFQSKPSYPEKLPKFGSGHYRVLEEWKKNNNMLGNSQHVSVPTFYDLMPDTVDIVLSHIPPFGVFDQMSVIGNWGSSSTFLQALSDKNVGCVLFGHVHAQRGYWEKIKNTDGELKIIGGCEYAKKTHDTREKGIIHDLMIGKDTVQFIANSALQSDRTVQPFAKKKLVGNPRVINAYFSEGQWVFHNVM